MIIKLCNNGERVLFYHNSISALDSLDNVLMVGKGIRYIIDNVEVRNKLILQYGKKDVLYLLCPEERDTSKKTIRVHLTSTFTDYNKYNSLNEVDPSEDIVPVILDRMKEEEGLMNV